MGYLNKGDTVRLKSGSPVLTVSNVFTCTDTKGDRSEHVDCVWFDGNKVCARTFNIEVLNKR